MMHKQMKKEVGMERRKRTSRGESDLKMWKTFLSDSTLEFLVHGKPCPEGQMAKSSIWGLGLSLFPTNILWL